jgi:porin
MGVIPRRGALIPAQQMYQQKRSASAKNSLRLMWSAKILTKAEARANMLRLSPVLTGPFNARPQDVLGIAAGRTHVNPRLAEGQRLQNASTTNTPVPVQNSEYPFKIFYNFNVTRRLSISPAGGTRAYPNCDDRRYEFRPHVLAVVK